MIVLVFNLFFFISIVIWLVYLVKNIVFFVVELLFLMIIKCLFLKMGIVLLYMVQVEILFCQYLFFFGRLSLWVEVFVVRMMVLVVWILFGDYLVVYLNGFDERFSLLIVLLMMMVLKCFDCLCIWFMSLLFMMFLGKLGKFLILVVVVSCLLVVMLLVMKFLYRMVVFIWCCQIRFFLYKVDKLWRGNKLN